MTMHLDFEIYLDVIITYFKSLFLMFAWTIYFIYCTILVKINPPGLAGYDVSGHWKHHLT
jgi:hypothetical protein